MLSGAFMAGGLDQTASVGLLIPTGFLSIRPSSTA